MTGRSLRGIDRRGLTADFEADEALKSNLILEARLLRGQLLGAGGESARSHLPGRSAVGPGRSPAAPAPARRGIYQGPAPAAQPVGRGPRRDGAGGRVISTGARRA